MAGPHSISIMLRNYYYREWWMQGQGRHMPLRPGGIGGGIATSSSSYEETRRESKGLVPALSSHLNIILPSQDPIERSFLARVEAPSFGDPASFFPHTLCGEVNRSQRPRAVSLSDFRDAASSYMYMRPRDGWWLPGPTTFRYLHTPLKIFV